MDEDAKKIIDRMSAEEQAKRLQELNERLEGDDPLRTWGSSFPPSSGYEELEEREYLKAKLGYSDVDDDLES